MLLFDNVVYRLVLSACVMYLSVLFSTAYWYLDYLRGREQRAWIITGFLLAIFAYIVAATYAGFLSTPIVIPSFFLAFSIVIASQRWRPACRAAKPVEMNGLVLHQVWRR